jgi:hypothetical protein
MSTQDHSQMATWLSRWGAQTGGEALELQADGTCSFTVQGVPMQLTLDAKHQQMLLAAIALDEDVSGQPAVMRAMLDFAHLGERSHHCGMSIAATGRPVVWRWQGIAQLDDSSFDNTLDNFVSSALQSREVIQTALQPSAQHGHAADHPLGLLRA